MSTVLLDTSTWVHWLRTGTNGPAKDVSALLDAGNVMVCGPVAAELIVGLAASQRATFWARLLAMPWAELDRDAWRDIGETGARLREEGLTLPLTDVIIAVAAVHAEAELWTFDGDFARIAGVLPKLRLRP